MTFKSPKCCYQLASAYLSATLESASDFSHWLLSGSLMQVYSGIFKKRSLMSSRESITALLLKWGKNGAKIRKPKCVPSRAYLKLIMQKCGITAWESTYFNSLRLLGVCNVKEINKRQEQWLCFMCFSNAGH